MHRKTQKQHIQFAKKGYILCLLVLLSWNLAAQEGHYYLTNYTPSLQEVDNNNFDIKQDRYGRLCFANRKGVLKFDGTEWYLIKTPSSVLSLMLSNKTNLSFVGCRNNFGYIEQDERGRERYVSISEKSKQKFTGEFFEIKQAGEYIYFLSDDYLVQYSLSAESITRVWEEVEGQSIFSILELDDQLFAVNDANKFYKVERSTLIPRLATPPEDSLGGVAFTAELSKRKVLVGYDDNTLFTFDGRSFTPFPIEDEEYFQKAEISDALVLNDSMLVFSTFRGGAVIVNSNNGKTINYLNYQTGLPDDEVYAIAKDESGGIWLTHQFGYTRADYKIPFRSFSEYYGLEGTVYAVEDFNDTLFVATSLGLYYLDTIKNYKEVETVVKRVRKKKGNRRTPTSFDEASQLDWSSETDIDKVNSFVNSVDRTRLNKMKLLEEQMTRLLAGEGEEKLKGKEKRMMRRNRRKIRQQIKAEEQRLAELEKEKEEQTKETKKQRANAKNSGGALAGKRGNAKNQQKKIPELIVEYVKTTETSLESVDFVYKKVKGLNGRCSQIVPFKNTLLIAASTGLYEVSKNLEIAKITSRATDVEYLYLSEETERMWISTANETVLAYRYNWIDGTDSLGWEFDNSFPLVQAHVTNIIEEYGKRLWLSTSTGIFKIEYNYSDEQFYGEADYFKIDNPYSDDVVGITTNDSIYFVLSSTFMTYNKLSNQLTNVAELSERFTIEGKYIHSQSNVLWFHNNINWNVFSPYLRKDSGFTTLELIGDIREIFLAKDKRKIFVITADNKIYTFYFLQRIPDFNNYSLFLKQITDKAGEPVRISEIQVEQEDNSLVFHISNPYYLSEEALEYQYRLTGINVERNWSEWSKASIIALNYLPSGTYELTVRSKDIFGKTNALEPVSFYVKPPYWQQGWFYILQIVVFSTLLLLSFRLNRTKLRNRAISKVLSYLTIILIFSYIETVAETYLDFGASPVYEFGVQVLMAMLIFPVERLLTRVLLKVKETV